MIQRPKWIRPEASLKQLKILKTTEFSNIGIAYNRLGKSLIERISFEGNYDKNVKHLDKVQSNHFDE